eukprot:jgi/Hompol1/4278/HPOL_003576-RA
MAEFFQYVGLQAVLDEQTASELDLDSQFFWLEAMLSLNADASQFTHPIVDDADKNPTIFDEITYNKGASILRMMSNILDSVSLKARPKTTLGADPASLFYKGLQRYQRQYKFADASTADLWRSLDQTLVEAGVTSISLSDIMPKWVSESGFPVIHVDFEPDRNQFILTQSQFTLSADTSSTVHDKLWPIFLTYEFVFGVASPNTASIAVSSSAYDSVLMTEKLIAISLPDELISKLASIRERSLDALCPPALLLLNINRVGFYRIDFSQRLTFCHAQAIGQDSFLAASSSTSSAIANRVFSQSDRAGFVSDTVAMMISSRGLSSVASLMDALQFLAFEPASSHTVWKAAIEGLHQILSILPPGHNTTLQLIDWAAAIIDQVADQTGWVRDDSTNPLHDIVRPDILSSALIFKSPRACAAGLELFKSLKWTENVTLGLLENGHSSIAIDATSLALIIAAGISQSETETQFNRVLKIAQASSKLDSPLAYDLWIAILKGLSWSSSAAHQQLVLELVQTSQRFRLQDQVLIYTQMASSSLEGALTIYNHLSKMIVDSEGSGAGILGSSKYAKLFEDCVAAFVADLEMLEKARSLARTLSEAGKSLAATVVLRGIERADAGIHAGKRLQPTESRI